MPDKKESLYPQDWFNKGEQDLEAAKILLSSNNLEVASFLFHQVVEKYLKGYLLSMGWKLRRIHDLEELLDDAVTYNQNFEKFRELARVASEYYIEERYPFLTSSELNREELQDVLEQIQALIEKIKKEVG